MSATPDQALYALFATPLGECAIAWRAGTVVAAHLPEETPSQTAFHIATRAEAVAGKPSDDIEAVIAAITSLLNGEQTDLREIPCDLRGANAFEQEVYQATRNIAPGETVTYGALAAQLGNKKWAQSVGAALSRNPIPIIVPCHRVLGTHNKLTGFSAFGGVQTKLRMLMIEGAQFGPQPGLFDGVSLDLGPR